MCIGSLVSHPIVIYMYMYLKLDNGASMLDQLAKPASRFYFGTSFHSIEMLTKTTTSMLARSFLIESSSQNC